MLFDVPSLFCFCWFCLNLASHLLYLYGFLFYFVNVYNWFSFLWLSIFMWFKLRHRSRWWDHNKSILCFKLWLWSRKFKWNWRLFDTRVEVFDEAEFAATFVVNFDWGKRLLFHVWSRKGRAQPNSFLKRLINVLNLTCDLIGRLVFIRGVWRIPPVE